MRLHDYRYIQLVYVSVVQNAWGYLKKVAYGSYGTFLTVEYGEKNANMILKWLYGLIAMVS